MKTLWFAKGPDVEKQRYSTFLACFHLQDAVEELQALEAPVAAFCCLLTYLMLQVAGTVTVSSVSALIGVMTSKLACWPVGNFSYNHYWRHS